MSSKGGDVVCRCDPKDSGRGDPSTAACQRCGKPRHGAQDPGRQQGAPGARECKGSTTEAQDIPPRDAQAQSHYALAGSIPDDPPPRAPANSISVPTMRAPANSLSIPPGQSRYSAAAIPENPRGQPRAENDVPEAPEDDPALTGPLGLRGDREGDEVFLRGVMERLAGVERRGSGVGSEKR